MKQDCHVVCDDDGCLLDWLSLSVLRLNENVSEWMSVCVGLFVCMRVCVYVWVGESVLVWACVFGMYVLRENCKLMWLLSARLCYMHFGLLVYLMLYQICMMCFGALGHFKTAIPSHGEYLWLSISWSIVVQQCSDIHFVLWFSEIFFTFDNSISIEIGRQPLTTCDKQYCSVYHLTGWCQHRGRSVVDVFRTPAWWGDTWKSIHISI